MTYPISAIIQFSFEEHGVRAVLINGEPWFVAADVCTALNLSNPTKSVSSLDDDEKALTSIQGLSRGNDQANIISESGMFTLVLRCRDAVKQGTLPHRFRKWVTSEVLPSIRKTGKYENPQYKPQAAELFNDDDTRCLTHLVWSMANGFHFDRAWTQAIWYALRRVTGVPSPQHFEIRQLPCWPKSAAASTALPTNLKRPSSTPKSRPCVASCVIVRMRLSCWARCSGCSKRALSSITAS
ncbi:hypothetical protein SODG_001639 [Sodalis praecaptivus]